MDILRIVKVDRVIRDPLASFDLGSPSARKRIFASEVFGRGRSCN